VLGRTTVNMLIICVLMKTDLFRRFGFLSSEVARLYAQQFDRLARDKLGLSQAQCRLLGVLARHEGDVPLSQAELAQRMGLTPMAVATLCDRTAAGGWIERRPHPGDRRVNQLHIKPAARKALERAMLIGDDLTSQALAGLTATERGQLVTLLAKAREGLLGLNEMGDKT
jgi:DNA-binding MarR family transcriptional regulator